MHPGGSARVTARDLALRWRGYSLAHRGNVRRYRERYRRLLLGQRTVWEERRVTLTNRDRGFARRRHTVPV